MKMREIDAQEADKVCDDGIYLGTRHQDKTKILLYAAGGMFYEILVTPDRNCWVLGGVEYDSREDLGEATMR